MGLTHLAVTVSHPRHPNRKAQFEFLVDSGVVYTVAPKSVLRRLGIRPHGSRMFFLVDATKITRRTGDAVFAFDGGRAASPGVFGERGDSALFETVSLEALGFVLDLLRRELRRLPMFLG